MPSNRIPTVGGDSGTWGTVLNNYLGVALVPGGPTGNNPSAGASTAAGSITYVSAQTSAYTISSNTAVTTGNETVIVNANGGNVTITLPSASTQPSAMHSVKRVDSPSYVSTNTVSVASVSSQTIDGTNATSTPIPIYVQYESLTFASDGSNWNII